MTPNSPPSPLPIVRIALIAGVLLFGVVIPFIHKQPGWTPAANFPLAIAYAQAALSAVAVVAAFVIRSKAAMAPDDATRGAFVLTGWSIGQGAALFGGVIFFLAGDWHWYAIGLVAMAISFTLLPIRGASLPNRRG